MKSMLIVIVMLAVALMTSSAMATQPSFRSASVSSQVSGAVISGNLGNDRSFATETAMNHSIAGFKTTKTGNTVTSTTFGNSTGYTAGYANNGLVMGIQGGSFNAQAGRSTGRK